MLEITKGNFSVRILAHSINQVGCEAITFQSTYENGIIHKQVMTHRWSRNAESGRAVPMAKRLARIGDDPAMPLHLGRNQSGMQRSAEEVDNVDEFDREIRERYKDTAAWCERMSEKYGAHKEIIARYIEPWDWITAVQTMGRDQLFHCFAQRCKPDATTNHQRLAVNMARLYRQSTPKRLEPGEWHLPYWDGPTIQGRHTDPELRVPLIWSTARAAWCSYGSPDKVSTLERATIRHDACIAEKHPTPLEHQLRARPDRGRVGVVPGFDWYRSMVFGMPLEPFDFGVLDTTYKDCDYVVL